MGFWSSTVHKLILLHALKQVKTMTKKKKKVCTDGFLIFGNTINKQVLVNIIFFKLIEFSDSYQKIICSKTRNLGFFHVLLCLHTFPPTCTITTISRNWEGLVFPPHLSWWPTLCLTALKSKTDHMQRLGTQSISRSTQEQTNQEVVLFLCGFWLPAATGEETTRWRWHSGFCQ